MFSEMIYFDVIPTTRSKFSLLSLAFQEDNVALHPDMGDHNIFPVVGCIPCSQRYLLSSLFEENQTVCSAEIKTLLSQKFGLDDSCKRLPHSKSSMPLLSAMWRHLDGDGSHRRLISSMRFEFPPDGARELDAYYCEIVQIESLPTGVFADSFELHRLVHNGGNYFPFA